jgi:predicted metal-dependent hydrolase
MTDQPLPVRRVTFDYPDDTDPAWNPTFPEFACGANSVSLLMPYAEPYFAGSMRAVLPDLEPGLRSRTEDFIHQEMQHNLQHRRFNRLLVARYPALARLERWIGRTYGWFGRTRSNRFNVAFAAGSETIAYALARWTEDHLDDMFVEADPVASTLFLWHLAEEVEHKSAAFDVFEAVDGSRLRYATAMLTSFFLLALFTITATVIMLWRDRRLLRPVTWYRLVKWAVSLGFEVVPTMAASALPGHHPDSFADPTFLPTWLRGFDPDTGTMPVWQTQRTA